MGRGVGSADDWGEGGAGCGLVALVGHLDLLLLELKSALIPPSPARDPIFPSCAGISTAAGVPDFRSGMGTVLATGPGAWELAAHKAARPTAAKTTSTLQVGWYLGLSGFHTRCS